MKSGGRSRLAPSAGVSGRELDVGTDSAACGETEGIEETENSSAAPKKSTGVRLGSLALRA
jgi:hypothetical protein